MTYLVTGGTSGIGLGTVKKLLASTGATVISVSRNQEKIKAIKNELAEYKARVDFYSADITDEAAVEDLAQSLATKYSAIDGIVNAAGIIVPGGIEECSINDWRKVMDANVTSVYIVTKMLLLHPISISTVTAP